MAAMDMADAARLADAQWVDAEFSAIAQRVMQQVDLTDGDAREINVIGAWFSHALLRLENYALGEGPALGMMFAIITAYLVGRLSQSGGSGTPAADEFPEAFREFLGQLLEADDAGGS